MIALFREIFLDEEYTSGGFYRPRFGDTVIDLGANIGGFALYILHRTPGVNVHCFEPGVDTRRRLEQNLLNNRLDTWVRVYPVGVSDVAKKMVLHGHRFAGSRSTLSAPPEGNNGYSESIECVSLAEAVLMTRVDHVDLLKIDVEGAEVDILTEQDQGTWSKIQRVVLEFHGSIRPGAREAVTASLKAHGFRIFQVIERTPGASDGVLQAIR
jgi:FkbM family methyltransferase